MIPVTQAIYFHAPTLYDTVDLSFLDSFGSFIDEGLRPCLLSICDMLYRAMIPCLPIYYS